MIRRWGSAATLALSLPVLGATLTVDWNGGGDYGDIQSAIDDAVEGDTVLVKRGEYMIRESINFNRLQIPPRPGGKNITLRSESGPGVTTIHMAAADDWFANVVIFENGETADSVLEGFTLTGGGGKLTQGGGGILCEEFGTSPTVINCVITGNRATRGGGVSCWQTVALPPAQPISPTFINCAITMNLAQDCGGGVACSPYTSPTFRNCRIAENVLLRGSGGGICSAAWSAPVLIACTIEGNVGEGGFLLRTLAVMEDCLIIGNRARRGGGIYCWHDSLRATNCVIFGNQASEEGGGVYCTNQSPPDTQNQAIFTNCTISRNSARIGGGVAGLDSSPFFVNCVVQGNSPESFWGRLSHCLTTQDPLFVRGGVFDFERFVSVDIAGNLEDMPDFIVEAPDFHLRPQSPAIDGGTGSDAPECDIEGTPRPQGAGCDIGAYEYVPPEFLRGDSNADGVRNISDPICVLGYLFGPAGSPSKDKVGQCLDAADANDDGSLDIADAVAILSHLFASAGPLPAAFDTCGVDPSNDTLDCVSFAPCAGP